MEDPGGPVDFGPKPKPTGPQVPLTARDPGSPAAPQSVELRLSLEAYDAAGGLDIPLPQGVSRVTVEVRFTRPSDLLGSLVKFAGTTGASRDLRSFRNATRTALPPFQVGSYPVTGNVLRVEPVISGEAPGDEFEVRVTMFR